MSGPAAHGGLDPRAKILLALGSNRGQRASMLDQARAALAANEVLVLRSSFVVETPALLPDGAPASWNQPFLNQVIEVESARDPVGLLGVIKAIEVQLGRRPSARWAPRPIDIDIVAFGALVMNSDALTLPHPQMHLRRFVLQPLCELAPQWLHPILGRSASALLAALPP